MYMRREYLFFHAISNFAAAYKKLAKEVLADE